MEREIVLGSFSFKNLRNNRPDDFTTHFNPKLTLDDNATYYIGLKIELYHCIFHELMLIQDVKIK